MSRTAPHTKVPSYCLWKTRGVGYVRLDGHRKVLPGPYGSEESKAAYKAVLAAWLAQTPATTAPTPAPASTLSLPSVPAAPARVAVAQATLDYSVSEFVRDYLAYAQVRYAEHNKMTIIRSALAPMLRLWGDASLREFGPKRLKLTRDEWVKQGLLRRECNRRAGWIKKAINWAVAQEVIGGDVPYRLAALEELKRGEQGVEESQPTQPVDEAIVEKTLAYCLPEVAAMARLQLLTAARCGELCIMRPRDIEMSGDIWKFRPKHHKSEWRGQDRVIFIGKRAQEVLKPFLPDDPDDYVFSPARADAKRREAIHEARVTPDGAGNNIGTNRSDKPERVPGERYTTGSYGRALSRACARAFPLPERLQKIMVTPTGRKRKRRPETEREWKKRLGAERWEEVLEWNRKYRWHSHQLRHTAGTRIREQFTPDAAQAVLGHKTLQATQIYAKVPLSKAAEVARLAG